MSPHEAFESALAVAWLRLGPCASPKAAIALRHRLNRYRARLRKEIGQHTPYEGIMISLDENYVILAQDGMQVAEVGPPVISVAETTATTLCAWDGEAFLKGTGVDDDLYCSEEHKRLAEGAKPEPIKQIGENLQDGVDLDLGPDVDPAEEPESA